MKISKKKVFTLALAVSLIAILSMGSLAWFTDSDSVTNEFFVAGSEDSDPDDIFSVDVREEGDEEDDGLDFENILPGDTLDKIAHVRNTGAYDQYIRVKITVSNAPLWQQVYKANLVPVTEFVNVDKVEAWNDIYGIHSALEGENFVYYLYYETPLVPDNTETEEYDPGDFVVFTEAYIAPYLTREQAATLPDGFSITVTADAVQTENVGGDVYEAFKTVGMEIPVNTTYVKDYDQFKAALAAEGNIVLMNNIAFERGLKVEKTVNLYLNDYTLSTGNDEYPYASSMTVTGDLTVGGYGTVLLPDLYGIRLDGTMNIYGGAFVDDEDRVYNLQEALINIYATGVLNVLDGSFSGTDYCVYIREEGATANLWGGTYTSINQVNANKLN